MVLIKDLINYLKKDLNFDEKDILLADNIKSTKLKSINSDLNSTKGDVSWISERVFKLNKSRLDNFGGSVLFVPAAYHSQKKRNFSIIRCSNPKYIFNMISNIFFVNTKNIFIKNNISDQLKNSNNTFIGQGSVIGQNVSFKENIVIGNNTVINNCIIGKNVKIGSNCTIGNLGFGFSKNEKEEFVRFPHVGMVIIKDNVEIDNNVCIDRGSLEDTLIYEGVKIDNQVHISHNVKVGENTIICVGSVVSGSVFIGKNCWISPGTVILNQIKIGNKASIGIGSVVLNDIKPNASVFGNPARVIPTKQNKVSYK